MAAQDKTCQSLLPIKGIVAHLKMGRHVSLPFHQQALVTKYVGHFVESTIFQCGNSGIRIIALNSGRTDLNRGDEYRFALMADVRGHEILNHVLEALLSNLPGSDTAKCDTILGKFSSLENCSDYFTGETVRNAQELSSYTRRRLLKECRHWKKHKKITLRFTSPTRIFSAENPTESVLHGRFKIHHATFCELVEQPLRSAGATICGIGEDLELESDNLFWTDNRQSIKQGELDTWGGVLGAIVLRKARSTSDETLQALVIGQYLGVGEKRGKGLGQYRLESEHGESLVTYPVGEINYLHKIATPEALEQACQDIARKHPEVLERIDLWNSIDEEAKELGDKLEDEDLIDLEALANRVASSLYRPDPLYPATLERPGRNPRQLSIPSLPDRILQRALVNELGSAIDKLSMLNNFGYRKGHSRAQARDKILSYMSQGYQWVFESDVKSFFDTLAFEEIYNRLASFFPSDPVVGLVMQWIKSPLLVRGLKQERLEGLPQGAPVSAMLANLILEGFDADIEAAGLKLIRYADDFVILCAIEAEAIKASEIVQIALNDISLEVNPKKTRVVPPAEPFVFLGYEFTDGTAVEISASDETTAMARAYSEPTLSGSYSDSDRTHINYSEPTTETDSLHNNLSDYAKLPEAINPADIPVCEAGSTLFVTQPCKNVRQINGALCVTDVETNTILQRCHWSELLTIVLFGRHNLSYQVAANSCHECVPIHLCSSTGRYIGGVDNGAPSHLGPEIWVEQMKRFSQESKLSLLLSRSLVRAKINNQLQVVRQRQRSHSVPAHKAALKALKSLAEQTGKASNLAELRGIEGRAAALYFQQMSTWVSRELEFTGRNKRPPKDPLNVLLSLGYTVIHNYAHSLAKIAGLHPWRGFYHQPHGSHYSLASDIVEPFRYVVDRTALRVLTRGSLTRKDFYFPNSFECRINSVATRKYLKALNASVHQPRLFEGQQVSVPQQMSKVCRDLVDSVRHNKPSATFPRLK